MSSLYQLPGVSEKQKSNQNRSTSQVSESRGIQRPSTRSAQAIKQEQEEMQKKSTEILVKALLKIEESKRTFQQKMIIQDYELSKQKEIEEQFRLVEELGEREEEVNKKMEQQIRIQQEEQDIYAKLQRKIREEKWQKEQQQQFQIEMLKKKEQEEKIEEIRRQIKIKERLEMEHLKQQEKINDMEYEMQYKQQQQEEIEKKAYLRKMEEQSLEKIEKQRQTSLYEQSLRRGSQQQQWEKLDRDANLITKGEHEGKNLEQILEIQKQQIFNQRDAQQQQQQEKHRLQVLKDNAKRAEEEVKQQNTIIRNGAQNINNIQNEGQAIKNIVEVFITGTQMNRDFNNNQKHFINEEQQKTLWKEANQYKKTPQLLVTSTIKIMKEGKVVETKIPEYFVRQDKVRLDYIRKQGQRPATRKNIDFWNENAETKDTYTRNHGAGLLEYYDKMSLLKQIDQQIDNKNFMSEYDFIRGEDQRAKKYFILRFGQQRKYIRFISPTLRSICKALETGIVSTVELAEELFKYTNICQNYLYGQCYHPECKCNHNQEFRGILDKYRNQKNALQFNGHRKFEAKSWTQTIMDRENDKLLAKIKQVLPSMKFVPDLSKLMQKHRDINRLYDRPAFRYIRQFLLGNIDGKEVGLKYAIWLLFGNFVPKEEQIMVKQEIDEQQYNKMMEFNIGKEEAFKVQRSFEPENNMGILFWLLRMNNYHQRWIKDQNQQKDIKEDIITDRSCVLTFDDQSIFNEELFFSNGKNFEKYRKEGDFAEGTAVEDMYNWSQIPQIITLDVTTLKQDKKRIKAFLKDYEAGVSIQTLIEANNNSHYKTTRGYIQFACQPDISTIFLRNIDGGAEIGEQIALIMRNRKVFIEEVLKDIHNTESLIEMGRDLNEEEEELLIEGDNFVDAKGQNISQILEQVNNSSKQGQEQMQI